MVIVLGLDIEVVEVMIYESCESELMIFVCWSCYVCIWVGSVREGCRRVNMDELDV